MAGSAVAPSHSGARTPVWLTEGGCWDCGPPAQRTAQVGQPPQGDCSDRKPTLLPAAVPAPSLHVHPLLPPSFPVSCNTSQAHPPQCHTRRDDFLPPLLTLATGTQGQPSYQRPQQCTGWTPQHQVQRTTPSLESGLLGSRQVLWLVVKLNRDVGSSVGACLDLGRLRKGNFF